MPVVLRIGPYRFGFFASDQDEPPHVHVTRERREAKFWIDPLVELEYNSRFAAHELNRIRRLVEENREFLVEQWNERFGQR
jgi:hypothetical protein